MADTIAVTGATGLIGGAVISALRERGYEDVVFTRDPRQARERIPGAADYIRYDLESGGEWEDALAGVDHVVNLAGAPLFQPFTGRRHLRKVTAQRIAGTRRLAIALRARPTRPRTLINASSVGVYGFGKPSDEPVDEASAPIAGEYARGSREWEKAAEEAGPDVRVVLMRLGFVLSSAGGGLRWQLEQASKGKVSYFAPGCQWLPWIHVDDIAAFVLHALEEDGWRDTYNLVAPEQVRSREFAQTLSHVTGAGQPRRSPALAARLFVGSGADILLGGRRVVPRRLQEARYDFHHSRLEDALRASWKEFA